jgi:hypothetical protein
VFCSECPEKFNNTNVHSQPGLRALFLSSKNGNSQIMLDNWIFYPSKHAPHERPPSKVPDLSAPSLLGFVRDNVQKGAQLRTDAWSGYNGIEVMGYKHIVINISDSGDPAHVVMPRVHRVAFLLVDGGLEFIKVRSDRHTLITISMNLRSDLTGAHPKPVVYFSSV